MRLILLVLLSFHNAAVLFLTKKILPFRGISNSTYVGTVERNFVRAAIS